MARPLVSNELWELVEPLIPKVHDRKVLTGILFVLRTGIPWEYLPREMGVRLRGHLLAAVAGVAAGRGVAAAA
jgi:transposase